MFAAITALSAAPLVATEIVYDNGAPPNLNVLAGSDFGFPAHLAERFQLDVGETMTGARWWGAYLDVPVPAEDDFTVRIYESVPSDTYGSIPAQFPLYVFHPGSVQRQLVDIPSGGSLQAYRYEVDLGPVGLAPNTTYWFSALNNVAINSSDGWFWAWSGGGGPLMWRRSDALPTWVSLGDFEMSLQILGVPEPTGFFAAFLGVFSIIGSTKIFRRD
jgi:hypothetical protein